MTQEKINQIREAAYCAFAKANAQLITNEWRGIDCGCKWMTLNMLMLRLQALDRSVLTGEELYNEYVTIETFALLPLQNNTAPSASVTNQITDSTTGKSQSIDALLLGNRAGAYDGILDTIRLDVGSDTYYSFGPVFSFDDIYSSVDSICDFYGLDIYATGNTGSAFSLIEKTDPSQYRGATNNGGSAFNGRPIGASATFNYSFYQADWEWTTAGYINPGETVISITKITIDGGSLGTVVYPFATPLDPFDVNSVIDGLSDLFGVNRVQYNIQNGDPVNYAATGQLQMTELYTQGPTSFITYSVNTGGGPVDVDIPITVIFATIGNGQKTFDLTVNTGAAMSGGVDNTTYDAAYADWTCVIADADASDELVSINVAGTDIPFTTPFTMSSDTLIGTWLTANAGAGTFTSAWNGSSLTIARTSAIPGVAPKHISWRRVIAPNAATQAFIGVNKFTPPVSALGLYSILSVDEFVGNDTYGREYLIYTDALNTELRIAEYFDGILRNDQSVYTATNPGQTIWGQLFFDSINNRIMAIVGDYPSIGPPAVSLYYTDSTLAPLTGVGAFAISGTTILGSASNSACITKNTSNGSYFISFGSGTDGAPATTYRDIFVYDPIFSSLTGPVFTESGAMVGAIASALRMPIAYDSWNNYIWAQAFTIPPASTQSIIAIDASTYAPVASYLLAMPSPSSVIIQDSDPMQFIYMGPVGDPHIAVGVYDSGLNYSIVPFNVSTFTTDLSLINFGAFPFAPWFFIHYKQLPNNNIIVNRSDGFGLNVKCYLLDSQLNVLGIADPGLITANTSNEIFYNPVIQQYVTRGTFVGIGIGTQGVYVALNTFGAFQPSDQYAPFNVGSGFTFTQTEEPVLATADNKCLDDDEIQDVAYLVGLQVNTCCGGDSDTTTQTVPANPTYTMYYGSSNTASLDASGVAALTPVTAVTFAGVYSFAATSPDPQYKYIAYPSSLGSPSSIIDTSNGYPVVMETPYNVTISGIQYTVYRTTNELGGAIDIQMNA